MVKRCGTWSSLPGGSASAVCCPRDCVSWGVRQRWESHGWYWTGVSESQRASRSGIWKPPKGQRCTYVWKILSSGYSTGRDVEYRELELRFSKERCVWDLVSDSAEAPAQLMPQEMVCFLEYMKDVKLYSGGNTELTEAFNTYAGSAMEPKRLKQMMNLWKDNLRELGLTFRSYRSNGQRMVEVRYEEPVTQVPQVTQKTAP